MTVGFDDIEWHDAILREVRIDRRDPGAIDEVILEIEEPSGRRVHCRFGEAWQFAGTMNFGIAGPDSILKAERAAEHPSLVELRARWSKLAIELSDLQCYRIETNSTASELRILARRFTATEGSVGTST